MKTNYFYSLILLSLFLIVSNGQSRNTISDSDLRASTKSIFFNIPNSSVITSFGFKSDNSMTYSADVKTQSLEQSVLEKVSLVGTLQDELGCTSDYNFGCDNPALVFNPDSGSWEGTFFLPAGCYFFLVKEDFSSEEFYYGENGIEEGSEIQLYIPSDGEISFSYDPQTHIITSTPYSGFPQEITMISFIGSLQDELGCEYDYDFECNSPSLQFNSDLGTWEGSFNLPAGCYSFWVRETFGCEDTYYGKNGMAGGTEIDLYIPSEGEITFSYDPQSHTISSTPYQGVPSEVTNVFLLGVIQKELGCPSDFDYECNNSDFIFNSDSGIWQGNFNLSKGCYRFWVSETFGCEVTFYGENGIVSGDFIQLYVPEDGEITFNYNPQNHILTSEPYSGVPEEVTKVSLIGTLQDELGCEVDYILDCDKSELVYNPDSDEWIGSFTLPAGCYSYYVREIFGCEDNFYGKNGIPYGDEIQLYVPAESEITFRYDPQNHMVTSTPYSGFSEEAIAVSLRGTLQDELGCSSDYEYECDKPALEFNSVSNAWQGTFFLPSGCYSFQVKETSVCNVTFYGEDGIEGGNDIQLYVPNDNQITFIYDAQSHSLSSTPYSGAPEEVISVSLLGNLQSESGCASDFNYECDKPELEYNPDSGKWIGNLSLTAGCYNFRVKETSACNVNYYGESGMDWGDFIQLYVPADSDVTFSYDPETHLLTSFPYSGAPQEITTVSLFGDLQDELGCSSDQNYECDKPALEYNPDSGAWEGKFFVPAGCYTYQVKETIACEPSFYGENGIEWRIIQLYVPSDSEITFSYDPQTHILTSEPYSGSPQEVAKVSLVGSFQDELGCASDYEYMCDNPKLLYNAISGLWEGSFSLTPGCYTYLVKETFSCNIVTFYGENGTEWGNELSLFVPSESEINFSYDPETNTISSGFNNDFSAFYQCPGDIFVSNSPVTCGAIVSYPEFEIPPNCAGEIFSITQTEGLPSGSFFPVGITTNSFLFTTSIGEEISCSFDVVVSDTESPIISDLNQVYEPLWPPNHKMVPVIIDYLSSDNCNISATEISISSNEPESGHGYGNKTPDWEIIDEHNILLRAERSGKGNGREYYITIKIIDATGNFSEQSVIVKVPKNNGKATQEFSESDFNNSQYILHPNAADDIIKIKGIKSVTNPPYTIYDISGVMKKQGTIIRGQIEVKSLPSGTYLLRFETDVGDVFKKFIKN